MKFFGCCIVLASLKQISKSKLWTMFNNLVRSAAVIVDVNHLFEWYLTAL